MKQIILTIILMASVVVCHSQNNKGVKELKYRYNIKFTGQVNNQADSVYVSEIEIDMPQEVEISDIVYDTSELSQQDLGKKTNGIPRCSKNKLVFTQGTEHFAMMHQSREMYLRDSNGQIYHVVLDQIDPLEDKGLPIAPDPKMILRKPTQKPKKQI